MDERKIPIIVGVGQHTNRSADLADAREPLEMMALVAQKAEEDAQARGLLPRLDSIRVVNLLAWSYVDAAGMLAERLGASPRDKVYSDIGGNMPQLLVNQTADAIAGGRVGLALLVGAEAIRSRRQARRQGVTLDWTPRAQPPGVAPGTRPGTREVEEAHGARFPPEIYPLFENAIRAHRGRTIPEHRERLGELCARFTQVADNNPYAWFPKARTKEEIITAGPDNRMIGFPYPKLMNAIIDVDQAAGIIMTSAATARELSIPEERWVYLWAGAEANDLWYFTDRVNYYTSPAIRTVGQKALATAGLSIDSMDYFDLYSCFPSVVQIARDMLGIAEDDPRPLTVTGGLPYAGGPGNNYSMHAIATMVERLRVERDKKGLVTALGYYLTKHAIGVYAGTPSGREWQRKDPASYQQELDKADHPELVLEPEGPAAIETYTVMYDREGQPERSVVVGRLEDGRRFIANTEADPGILEAMVKEEAVGRRGHVHHDPAQGINLFRF
ncbi:MAG: acetyl-CoA acetyltransferase [Dehalococcoidia bacterium]